MPIKKGTICHRYTPEEFSRIKAGDFLPGIDRRSQVYALQRYEARIALGREKGKRTKEPELPEWHGYEFPKGKWV